MESNSDFLRRVFGAFRSGLAPRWWNDQQRRFKPRAGITINHSRTRDRRRAKIARASRRKNRR